MNDQTLQLMADELADTWELLANRLPEARQRLRSAMRGQPGAQSFDGPGRAQGHSDPTASAGLTPDPARQDDMALAQIIQRALKMTRIAEALCARYSPRPASSLELRRVTETNEPHCQSCARIETSKGIPLVERDLHTKAPTTVKGNLTDPLLLCRWCWTWVAKTGRLPHRRELRDRQAGKRVYLPTTRGGTHATA